MISTSASPFVYSGEAKYPALRIFRNIFTAMGCVMPIESHSGYA